MTDPTAYGTLYGISVGPGDPELLTIKGLRLLQQAPIVAFPAGVRGKPGFAEQAIAQWLQPTQVQLPLTFPYVQDTEVLLAAWQLAADQIWHYLEQGQNVAFACEGDVSFYSTFTYLAQTLQQRHPQVSIQPIPGVCSPLASAAAFNMPLTFRQQRLVVLPALYTVTELETVLQWADVVVLMKVSSVYAQVWTLLQQYDLLPHSYAIAWATLPQQQIYTNLQTQPNLALPYFSLLIIQVTAKVKEAAIAAEPVGS